MFRAHRPIFRRIQTAVPTTIGSVFVPFWSRVLYVVQSPRPATTYRTRDQNGTDTEPMVVGTCV